MKHYDIIIIGAGISGLSLAHSAARDSMKTLVIDKENKAGGCLNSHRPDGAAAGFWIELGAHTAYNSYTGLLKIIEECGMLQAITPRRKVSFKVLVNNTLKSIPSQIHFFDLLLSAPRLFTEKKDGKTIRAYYSRIVGEKNFQDLFRHAFNSVISQNADDFPADLLFKKRTRRTDIIKSYTMTNGLQTIADTIIAKNSFDVMLDTSVRSIAVSGGIFRVDTSDNNSFESDCLALAVPVAAASELLSGPFPDIANLLASVRTEIVESLGIVVPSNRLSRPLFAGIIAVEDRFFSVVSRDTVEHSSYRGFTFHFKPGLLDHDAKIRRAAEVLGIQPKDIEDAVPRTNMVPGLRAGHNSIVEKVDGLLSGKRLLLSGNYFAGLAIEDCVQRSFSEFKRLKQQH